MWFFASLIVILCSYTTIASTVPNVTITAWQYCEGCKVTVDIYSHVAANELRTMDKAPPGQRKQLDAGRLVDHLCDNPLFQKYGEFSSYSCIKTLDDEYRLKFLEAFAGTTRASTLLNKRSIFDRKRKVSEWTYRWPTLYVKTLCGRYAEISQTLAGWTILTTLRWSALRGTEVTTHVPLYLRAAYA
jgi:hypothetical protein